MNVLAAVNPIPSLKKKWRYLKYNKTQIDDTAIITKKINGINFTFDFSLSPKRIKKMYFGIYEFEIQNLLRKYLKPGDIFFDVGANIGYLTAIAMSIIGKNAEVHCFEPVPKYFQHILKIAKLNPNYKIKINNFALGDKTGDVSIFKHRENIGGSSLIADLISKENVSETFTTKIERLDDYLERNKISRVSFMKIDTEGFELPVLLGAARYFSQNKDCLPPIIAEITPQAFYSMKRNISELHDFMSDYGYKSYSIPQEKQLDIRKLTKQTDILFKK